PITVVVLNNGVLGEEGHRQARMKLEPYGVRLHNPDFAAYARACGGEGYAVETTRELDRALKEALSSRRPCIVDVATQAVMPAWPTPRGTLRPGRPQPAEQAEPLRV
ncbi:MAG TPA: thiamine pyrophosphate-dependent enzyme, partial [Gemmataceae bacterium]